eukprot:m.1254632 g.1254632  ORF g.1254632 m.1254632 type:complete len:82 (+) comp24709_c0_seq8:4001-4246(+)
MPCLFPFIPVMSARPFRISGATPDASSKKIPPTVLLDLPTDTELRTWIHQYIAKRKLKVDYILCIPFLWILTLTLFSFLTF